MRIGGLHLTLRTLTSLSQFRTRVQLHSANANAIFTNHTVFPCHRLIVEERQKWEKRFINSHSRINTTQQSCQACRRKCLCLSSICSHRMYIDLATHSLMNYDPLRVVEILCEIREACRVFSSYWWHFHAKLCRSVSLLHIHYFGQWTSYLRLDEEHL